MPFGNCVIKPGRELGDRGGIRVNEHLQTNDPNIWAVSDAIEVRDRHGRRQRHFTCRYPSHVEDRHRFERRLTGRRTR
jgi:hypothetical protein